VQKIRPDIVVALTDLPWTPAPHSFKRVTKSVDRSLAWLREMLRPMVGPEGEASHPLQVFVQMVGGGEERPRTAFAEGLLETLYHKEAETISPLKTADEGVAGYVFDLVPIRIAVNAAGRPQSPTPSTASLSSLGSKLAPDLTSPMVPLKSLVPLLHASLDPLPIGKPRVVNSARSPHEMLGLIQDVGIDFFDAWWAQRAADVGIALDFVFPAPPTPEGEIRALGHNLYDERYANDFNSFASSMVDGVSGLASVSTNTNNDTNTNTHRNQDPEHPTAALKICPCIACSPVSAPSTSVISHSKLDPRPPGAGGDLKPPFTRGYVHHLLHTHEMSAHTLLTAHNLAILDAFFAGIRSVLGLGPGGNNGRRDHSNETKDVADADANVVKEEDADRSRSRFATEAARFAAVYDEGASLYAAAVRDWADVELARGKGRLAREKAKQEESTLGTAIEH
jgi:hypothetical protein